MQTPVASGGLTVLPSSRVAFNRQTLGSDVATFAQQYLASKGEQGQLPGLFPGHAFNKLTADAQTDIAKLLDRYGDSLDTRYVERAIDKSKYRLEWKKTNRRVWWVSGGFCIGALLGFAAAGYAQGLGFKAMFSPKVAEAVQAGWNPIWYTFAGALSGAFTGLFLSKVSSPAGAFIIRQGYKKAPVQPHEIGGPLHREFLDIEQMKGTVDGRYNGAAWYTATYKIDTEPSWSKAGEHMREARRATDPAQKQEAIELAGMFVARQLINDELYWYPLDPSNLEVFENLRLARSAGFTKSSPEDIAAFRKAVIDEVRRERKNVESEGRAKLEEAIKDYYDPYLDRILMPPKQEPKPVEIPVAHAG